MNKIKNAFTIDVEDYFQVEAFSGVVDRAAWNTYECRVEHNTDIILDLLDTKDIKGTFFVLGWIAKKYPALVKKIVQQGHEIASHGMTHQLIYKQTPKIFKEETHESKILLEDLAQTKVLGYRAATYSITEKSLWALDILLEEGFKYDSSIFPIRHDRYGIPGMNPEIHKIKSPKGGSIIEFPISIVKANNLTIPIAGGGYFRLFPFFVSKWGLAKINKTGKPFVFYLHPWELDPGQPVMKGISNFTKFRHYVNISKANEKLSKLISTFEFTTMKQVLNNSGFPC